MNRKCCNFYTLKHAWTCQQNSDNVFLLWHHVIKTCTIKEISETLTFIGIRPRSFNSNRLVSFRHWALCDLATFIYLSRLIVPFFILVFGILIGENLETILRIQIFVIIIVNHNYIHFRTLVNLCKLLVTNECFSWICWT